MYSKTICKYKAKQYWIFFNFQILSDQTFDLIFYLIQFQNWTYTVSTCIFKITHNIHRMCIISSYL